MRDKAFTMRLCGSAAAAIMLVLGAGCLVQAGSDTAAHDIAEKFAREAAKGDAKTRPVADTGQRKADSVVRKAGEDPLQAEEAEMLARARAEAEQRRVDMMRARAEAELSDRQRKADEELGQAEVRRKAQEDARLAEEANRKAEEERRLLARKAEEDARAEALRQAEVLRQAEEDARIAAEVKQAEEVRVQAEAQRKAEEARLAEVRRAEELARAEEARRTAEDEQRRAALQSEREAEAQRLADRLRSVREEREARAAGDSATARRDVSAGPATTHHKNSSKAPMDIDIATQRERRVAVLLLMQPGDRGIRRNNKSADPVLCSYHDCYVSNGPDSAASLLPARKALGFFRTWGSRAGACNNSLGCVFRGVELGNLDGMLMPVDMRVVRHDRREPREVEAVSDCRLERDRLVCRNGIYADDYAMWLVPESLAGKIGPAALLQALHDGLPASERTASAPSR